jgi:hypothetical protein
MKLGRLTDHWSFWKTLIVLVVGVALSFGVMFALSGVLEPLGSAAVVLFGVALTFAVLAMTPVEGEQLHWAVAPAAIISLFGWMFMVEAASLPDIARLVWPIVVIAYFAYDIYRHSERGHGSTPAMHA